MPGGGGISPESFWIGMEGEAIISLWKVFILRINVKIQIY